MDPRYSALALLMVYADVSGEEQLVSFFIVECWNLLQARKKSAASPQASCSPSSHESHEVQDQQARDTSADQVIPFYTACHGQEYSSLDDRFRARLTYLAQGDTLATHIANGKRKHNSAEDDEDDNGGASNKRQYCDIELLYSSNRVTP